MTRAPALLTGTYLASLALSACGNSVAAVALPLVLLATTGDVLAAGALAVATTVPSVLAGVLGGSVVDRFDRRWTAAAGDVVSGLSVAALPVVDHLTGLSPGWFVLFGVLGALGDVPGTTARDALVPALARATGTGVERLVAAREAVSALAVLLGPACAGVLVVLLGGVGVLWVTAAASLLAAALALLLPRALGVPEQDPAGSPVAGWRGTLAGLQRLTADARLRAATLLSLASVVVLVAFQGLLLPVHFTATGRPDRLGFVLSALAGGMLLGAAAFAVLAGRLSRRAWVVGGALGTVPGLALLAALPPYPWLLAGAALFGFASAPVGAVLGAAVLELTPDHLRGRVNGAQTSILLLAAPLGTGAAAVLVDRAGAAGAALVVLAGWCLAVVLAVLAPSLRRLATAPAGASADGTAAAGTASEEGDPAGVPQR